MRRSLLVWGWGQASSGDRRGWLGPPAHAAAMVALALALPLATGVAAPFVFVLAVSVVVAWAAVAVHAWHAAARARVDQGAWGGGHAVLWLVPVVLAAAAGTWIVGGPGADPALALDAYLADWRAGRAESAAMRFVRPPSTTAVRSAWQGQEGALRNAVVRVVAADPEVEADPARLLDGLRWVDLGATPDGGRRLGLEAARSERVRQLLLGVLPTTAQRILPVARLGIAELRAVPVGGGLGPLGPVVAWRLVRIEIAGETLAGG